MHPWLVILLVLVGMVLFAVAWGILFPLVAAGGYRPGELRDVLVNRALRTYTHEGAPIPGLRPGLVARTVLWLLRYREAPAPVAGKAGVGRAADTSARSEPAGSASRASWQDT